MRALLIAYNNNSFIHYFPLGLAYVASHIRQGNGHDVVIYGQDQYHLPDEQLTQYLDENDFDAVGIGMCAGYYQYAKLLKLVDAVHKSKKNHAIWLGGHLVSPDTPYFKKLTNADWVCGGEIDYTDDLDNLPLPAWDLFDINYYSLIRLPHAENSDRCFPVLSGRGCPFKCTFCYRMHKGYRARSIKNIVDEVRKLQKDYHISYIDFADELLMINPQRAVDISHALKPLGIKWMCNGRLNYARTNVLKEMKEAGCVFINYGIESVEDEILKKMDKKLTFKQIVSGVEATQSVGISAGLNMIWGNIGDTRETLNKSVDFLLKYDDWVQMRTIRPVTPYPGSALYETAIEMGLLKGTDDFYKKHVNSDLLTVNFTTVPDDSFHTSLYHANLSLIRSYYNQYFINTKENSQLLYGGDTSFRGFRQT